MQKDYTKILVLYDTEEEYSNLMGDYLKRQKNIPWEIHVYTNPAMFREEERRGEIALLVVSESAYQESMLRMGAESVVVLSESGMKRWERVHYISKYQSADRVYRELLQLYADNTAELYPTIQEEGNTRFIGFFSPIRRCMQSSFALTLGHLLAKNESVLYLNFEHFIGNGESFQESQHRDLSDVLYYLNGEKEKFPFRFKASVIKKGNLDYIPPMKCGEHLLDITKNEWLELLQQLDKMEEYSVVILDLSESMHGLFDLLKRCHQIFTIVTEDTIGQNKLLSYEHLLEAMHYTEIVEKTLKCRLPKHITGIPEYIEDYGAWELTEYVSEKIEELKINGVL